MVFAVDVPAGMVDFAGARMKITIVIPAHNEANRIGKTLQAYHDFFASHNAGINFLVVLNGCSDNTLSVVNDLQQKLGSIEIFDLKEAGKGLAIKAGFAQALQSDAQLIGFVDADMATSPEQFARLIDQLGAADGIIASRYLKESTVVPARPPVKEWGRRLVYQPLVWLLFGLRFADYQCGAKLFKRAVIAYVTPRLTVRQWAFDVELLYLCKRGGFTIKEVPTVWHDQADSKLKILGSGLPMLSALFKTRWRHSYLHQLLYGKDT